MAFRSVAGRIANGVLVVALVGGALAGCGPSQPGARPTVIAVPAMNRPTPSAASAGSPATPALVATVSTAQPAKTSGASATEIADRARTRSPLTVEEYRIVADGADKPERMEYSKLIDPAIKAKRTAWRSSGDRIADAVAALERLGYRVAAREGAGETPAFDVSRDGTVLLQEIPYFRLVPGSGTGADAALIAYPRRGEPSLVRKASVEPWDEGRHAFTRPVIVGGELTWVEPESGQTGEQVAVVKAGKRVATLPAGEMGVDLPVKGLWSWDGKWVAEVRGQVYVDGESLNERIGADEVFEWRLIDGRPFYFFVKDGETRVSFDGETLPQSYEQVVHYRCCEPAIFNVGGNDRMVWFHALRDGAWHYVEMGVYDGVAPPAAPPVPAKRPASIERPSPVSASPIGSPELKRGNIADARKLTGLDVRAPKYLPDGAKPDGDVAFTTGESALASISYRIGSDTLEVRFARQDLAAAESRGEQVDLGPRKAVYVAQVKEPTDGTAPLGRVGWVEGDAFVSVIGTLPKGELVKVAASLAAPAEPEPLGAADLGPGWSTQVAAPASDGDRIRRLFVWSGAGERSPEGLREIVYEVERHPDAAAAQAALGGALPPGARAASGPEVGEAARYYALTQDGLSGVVVEAVSGPVRVRVGVLGLPQSQVKETKAAELARTVLERTRQ